MRGKKTGRNILNAQRLGQNTNISTDLSALPYFRFSMDKDNYCEVKRRDDKTVITIIRKYNRQDAITALSLNAEEIKELLILIEGVTQDKREERLALSRGVIRISRWSQTLPQERDADWFTLAIDHPNRAAAGYLFNHGDYLKLKQLLG